MPCHLLYDHIVIAASFLSQHRKLPRYAKFIAVVFVCLVVSCPSVANCATSLTACRAYVCPKGATAVLTNESTCIFTKNKSTVLRRNVSADVAGACQAVAGCKWCGTLDGCVPNTTSYAVCRPNYSTSPISGVCKRASANGSAVCQWCLGKCRPLNSAPCHGSCGKVPAANCSDALPTGVCSFCNSTKKCLTSTAACRGCFTFLTSSTCNNQPGCKWCSSIEVCLDNSSTTMCPSDCVAATFNQTICGASVKCEWYDGIGVCNNDTKFVVDYSNCTEASANARLCSASRDCRWCNASSHVTYCTAKDAVCSATCSPLTFLDPDTCQYPPTTLGAACSWCNELGYCSTRGNGACASYCKLLGTDPLVCDASSQCRACSEEASLSAVCINSSLSRCPSRSATYTSEVSMSATRSPLQSVTWSASMSATRSPLQSVTWSNSVMSTASSTVTRTPSGTKTPTHSGSGSLAVVSLTETEVLTPTPTQPLPPPATTLPPVAAVSQAVVASVSVTTAVVAASAAGSATMQATLSASSCSAANGDSDDPSPGASNPAMFMVSPFVGNSFAMIGGNVGLIVAVLTLHGAVAGIAVHQGTKRGQHAVEILTAVRFPNFTIVFAKLMMQGVVLGGWQLMWSAMLGDERQGPLALCVVAALASFCVSFALPWWLTRVRRDLLTCDCASGYSRGVPLEAVPIDYGLFVRTERIVRACGPTVFWTPRAHRLMLGSAFNDYGVAGVGGLAWHWMSGWVLPMIVSAASAARPPVSARAIVCNVLMLGACAAMIAFAAAVMLKCPYRLRGKNLLEAVVKVGLGVTCLMSCPLTDSQLGPDAVATALGVVGILQSGAILALGFYEMLSFLWVDNTMANQEVAQSTASGENEDAPSADYLQPSTLLVDNGDDDVLAEELEVHLLSLNGTDRMDDCMLDSLTGTLWASVPGFDCAVSNALLREEDDLLRAYSGRLSPA